MASFLRRTETAWAERPNLWAMAWSGAVPRSRNSFLVQQSRRTSGACAMPRLSRLWMTAAWVRPICSPTRWSAFVPSSLISARVHGRRFCPNPLILSALRRHLTALQPRPMRRAISSSGAVPMRASSAALHAGICGWSAGMPSWRRRALTAATVRSNSRAISGSSLVPRSLSSSVRQGRHSVLIARMHNLLLFDSTDPRPRSRRRANSKSVNFPRSRVSRAVHRRDLLVGGVGGDSPSLMVLGFRFRPGICIGTCDKSLALFTPVKKMRKKLAGPSERI